MAVRSVFKIYRNEPDKLFLHMLVLLVYGARQGMCDGVLGVQGRPGD